MKIASVQHPLQSKTTAVTPFYATPPKAAQGPGVGLPGLQAGLALKAALRFASTAPTEKPQVTPTGRVLQYQQILQERYGEQFKLDPFQVEAMTHLENGKSVMVSAPTSSGKTLVADFAIETLIRKALWPDPNTPPQRGRLFYTAPRKAISNEKFRDFSDVYNNKAVKSFVDTYGPQNVGIMTGDVTHNPNAPVILMTTEVLRNMLYEEPEKLNDVGKVVFDECHFVNDEDRGPVWEECIMGLADKPEIQQIHLSATVGNAPQYVGWMNAVAQEKSPTKTASAPDTMLVSETKRPVSLKHLVFNPHTQKLEPLLNDGSTSPTKAYYQAFSNSSKHFEPRALLGAMAQYKAQQKVDLLPVIITLFSKKLCNQYFNAALGNEGASQQPQVEFRHNGKRRKIRPQGGRNGIRPVKSLLPNGAEGDAMRTRLRELIEQHKQLDPTLEKMNPKLVKGLMNGYGVHHAGMTYAERLLVERALKAGLLKVVFATDTLGAGINCPVRSAAFPQFTKRDKEDYSLIDATVFHQIQGRAGRRGMYEPGYSIIVPPKDGRNKDISNEILMDYVVDGLINAGPEKIVSKFQATPGMVLNMLKSHSLEQAREKMGRSFSAFQMIENQLLGKRTPEKARTSAIVAFKDHQARLAEPLKQQFDEIVTFLADQGLVTLGTDPVTQAPTAHVTPFGSDLTMVPNTAFSAVLALLSGTVKTYQGIQSGKPVTLSPNEKILSQLDALRPSELASLLASTLNEKGEAENGSGSGPFVDIARAFTEEAYRRADDALDAGIANQTPLNFTLSPFVEYWAESGDWMTTRREVEQNGLYIGDFMNVARRTSNLLEKLSEMKTLPPNLRAKFATARDLLLVTPVKENVDVLAQATAD